MAKRKRARRKGLGSSAAVHTRDFAEAVKHTRSAIKESLAATSCSVRLARLETAAYNYGVAQAHALSAGSPRKMSSELTKLGDARARARNRVRACLKE